MNIRLMGQVIIGPTEFDALGSLIAKGANSFLEMVRAALNFILKFMFDLFGSVIQHIYDALPTGWQPSVDAISHYVSIINVWVPVTFGITLMVMFYTFLAVFITIKFTLKLIPFIG